MNKKIAISAVEVSGDLLASSLIKALVTQADFYGLAGDKMQEVGCQKYWDIHQVSVMGFVEVLKKLPSLLRLRRQIIKTLSNKKPDCFIGVDGPDFNFLIERRLKQQGIKTIHFVSPSLWAWRAGRIKKIKKSTDLMLCVFPFEVDFYQQHQMKSVFVGHPLAKQLKPRENHQKTNQILLMPGSRRAEIYLILPVLLAALPQILKQNSTAIFVISLADDKHLIWVKKQIKICQLAIKITVGDAQIQLMQSHLVLLASGTATLEAMMIGVPMVVVHKTSWLTYQIAQRLLTTQWISLPNILAQESLVPELLQNQANADNISQAVNQLLVSDNQALINRFKRLREQLMVDTPTIIRQKIMQFLDE